MNTTRSHTHARRALLCAGGLLLAAGLAAQGQLTTVSGSIQNQSLWRNTPITFSPPGDGGGQGTLIVGLWSPTTSLPLGAPSFAVTNENLKAKPLPFASGPYAYTVFGVTGATYIVAAWLDGNNDGVLNMGEPWSGINSVTLPGVGPAPAVNLTITDDYDNDDVSDWWEAHWAISNAVLVACDPFNPDGTADPDGDGLSNFQEFLGVDGLVYPVTDSLTPVNADSDSDLLIDSFEAAWYDPSNGVDPAGGYTNAPTGTNKVNIAIASADPDQDGLTCMREMALLDEFRQSQTLEEMWVTDPSRSPYIYRIVTGRSGNTITMALMSDLGANLNLGLVMTLDLAGNRTNLRDEEWTDPTDGTGYAFVDEPASSGRDTDQDQLPDGWEVEFNLDPRDDGILTGFTNGLFGDPDGDGLQNWQEYLGQDGNRSATKPLVNGSGDETNPNEYNWRPDSTYLWRWFPTNLPLSYLTDPRKGTGINRAETLGSALPTLSLGQDVGTDSDDDGIADNLEINPVSGPASSPVHSTDPFIMRSARITSANGITIPDPEPALAAGSRPAGRREDMQRRNWTIECLVNLQAANLNGDLFNFATTFGPASRNVYRLILSNNVPVLTAQSSDGSIFNVTANELPQNRWVHLAAVWDQNNNSVGLYVQGVLFLGQSVFSESAASAIFPATNSLAFGRSSGSFVNNLLIDEIRIWGVARTGEQISRYAMRLAPQNNGDDAWISAGNSARFYSATDTLLVNGGSLFEGELGAPLNNVFQTADNYWLDGNADTIFQSATDVILSRGATNLVEGSVGVPVANVLFNDKDGSGGFTTDSLLAYYRFDDGGVNAEDFARKAKNSLAGATAENYLFGDRGYALSNGFAVVTNNAAPVCGVDERGSDDSDGDGLPDAWELVNNLNAYDNGTGQESSFGLRNGPNGADGDVDGDDLKNIYEFWAETNPRDDDSDSNSVGDAQEDLDGDGVVNLTEQALNSRPDLVDTDDDGLPDNIEQGNGTGPAEPSDPPFSRSVVLGGAATDYLEVPLAFEQRLLNWTLEGLVNPASLAGGSGAIVRRAVQNLSPSGYALNYSLGVESNAGALRAYAQYIQPNGAISKISGGSVPPGAFTHVAASYNSLTATMLLYVNGVVVSSASNFFLAPPVNGKGGETFVRIGEDFQGLIDEVRIWNVVRSGALIATNVNRTVLATESNLVHYFRFDDGQATNSLLPFSVYHQPEGAQDYTSPQDWNDQWKHAAVFNGNVAFSGSGGLTVPPSLRVILLPPEAVSTGAQWAVDGGVFRDSADTATDLTAGNHVIQYKSIAGFVAPAAETVTLTNSQSLTITRSYTPFGSVKINLEPLDAVNNGAQWSVDGGPLQDTGDTVALTPGAHTVSYTPVSGYATPTTETITVQSGVLSEFTRFYTVIPPTLSVTLLPAEAVAAGAQWSVDGGALQNSGVTNTLTPGPHALSFASAAGYIAPPNETIILTNGQLSSITRTYIKLASLTINFSPGGLTGANWRVNGGAPQAGGATVLLSPGTYSISYSTVSGYVSPANESVTLTDGQEASLLRSYLPFGAVKVILAPTAAVAGGAKWSVDGGAFQNSGTTVSLSPGSHTLSFAPVVGFTTPSPETVLIDSGITKTLNRTYTAVDSDGDGMPDFWELAYGLNPGDASDAAGDPDADALSNLTEYQLGTNPLSSDTDGDGASDLTEVRCGSDPANPNSVPPKQEFNDFDGDGATDITVNFAALGLWYILPSGGGAPQNHQWGFGTALPAPADYDGDDVTDIAVMNPADGKWYVFASATDYTKQWNWYPGDVVPVPYDYDGDNRAEIAVYKPSQGIWLILHSATDYRTSDSIQWGWSATKPVPGDYDGDCKADIGVYHPADGRWFILQSTDQNYLGGQPIQWGWPAAQPVPADYDGDRRLDVAVYYPGNGSWYIRKSSDGQFFGGGPIQWGWAAAIPCPGDYDNDGKSDLAVYYPAGGLWYIRKSSDGQILGGGPIPWGFFGAKPPKAP